MNDDGSLKMDNLTWDSPLPKPLKSKDMDSGYHAGGSLKRDFHSSLIEGAPFPKAWY
jgi:hypothetical protein